MNATVHFYDDIADCAISVPNGKGNKTVMFESVSECWDYAMVQGLNIERVVTHSWDGTERITLWSR